MPVLIIGLVFYGIGATIWACDQHSKRCSEQNEFRVALAALEAELRRKEARLAELATELETRSQQVVELAAGVVRLRAEIACRRADLRAAGSLRNPASIYVRRAAPRPREGAALATPAV